MSKDNSIPALRLLLRGREKGQLMSEQCTHNCETCGVDCASRSSAQKQQDFKVNAHPLSNIKKVIAVVSGKGGVGKSLVTSLLAVNMNRAGKHSAILDADITGPSIPKLFGIHEKALGNEDGILPCKSKTGIDVMSINLLLETIPTPSFGAARLLRERSNSSTRMSSGAMSISCLLTCLRERAMFP